MIIMISNRFPKCNVHNIFGVMSVTQMFVYRINKSKLFQVFSQQLPGSFIIFKYLNYDHLLVKCFSSQEIKV